MALGAVASNYYINITTAASFLSLSQDNSLENHQKFMKGDKLVYNVK